MKKMLVMMIVVVLVAGFARAQPERLKKEDKNKAIVERTREKDIIVERSYLYGSDKLSKICIDTVRYSNGDLLDRKQELQADLAYWQSLDTEKIAEKIGAIQAELAELAAIEAVE